MLSASIMTIIIIPVSALHIMPYYITENEITENKVPHAPSSPTFSPTLHPPYYDDAFHHGAIIPAINMWKSVLNVKQYSRPRLWGIDQECPNNQDMINRIHSQGDRCNSFTCNNSSSSGGNACGPRIRIPHQHIRSQWHCPTEPSPSSQSSNNSGHNASSSCELFTSDAYRGVSNVDHIIYVFVTSSCVLVNRSPLLDAGSCRYDLNTNRPIAGYIELCNQLLDDFVDNNNNNSTSSHVTDLISRAIGVSLGFSQRTLQHPHVMQQSSNKLVCDESYYYFHSPIHLSQQDRTLAYLSAPTLLNVTKSWFSCYSVLGAPITLAIDAGPMPQSPQQHQLWWSAQHFHSELMSSWDYYHDSKYGGGHGRHHLTNLTVAFFHDTGWYQGKFDSPVITMPTWGLGSGCAFASTACPRGFPFCNIGGPYSEEEGCSADHLGPASCMTWNVKNNHPRCPHHHYYHNTAQRSCKDMQPSTVAGSVNIYGEALSKCVITRPALVPSNFAMSSEGQAPRCVLLQCLMQKKHIQVTIRGGWTRTCMRDGQAISFPGHNGRVICPPFRVVCEIHRALATSTAAISTTTTIQDDDYLEEDDDDLVDKDLEDGSGYVANSMSVILVVLGVGCCIIGMACTVDSFMTIDQEEEPTTPTALVGGPEDNPT